MITNQRFTENDHIVILTGAGISAESGIKTFRDHNGLWENHKVEDVATPQAFMKNPQKVWRFYKERYEQLSNVIPNAGHKALVDLEIALGNHFHLITQNIDGLHTKAGNQNVIEMHGSLHTALCTSCHTKTKMTELDLSKEIPLCPLCNAAMRPDIVWFYEIPYHMDQIEKLLQKADFFITIGTSGVVYPAAQFLLIAKYAGATTIGINLDKPDNLSFINEFHQGKSGEILPLLIQNWLQGE